MRDVLELADQLWRGDVPIEAAHPFSHLGEFAEVAPRTGFVASMANISAFDTNQGLVLVDTGSFIFAPLGHNVVRAWTAAPLHTAVFTHGHVDHCFGVDLYEADSGARARVIAHEAILDRYARYRLTKGYNGVINARQFGVDAFEWPTDYRDPDETYRTRVDLAFGDEPVELHHARGETDDHTWVWFPKRKVLCTGDLFIWASPNCGNPQKVQRYPIEWARALRTMHALGAEVLLPGHGLPIVGADRVRQALDETARLLEVLHDETVAMMNAGATLDDIVHTVKAPPDLLERPYLRPVYDEPEFVVRNTWRLYGGWWDGDPAGLEPAPRAGLAREVAALAGGVHRLAARAREVAAAGDLRLAGQLAEWAMLAAPGDDDATRTRRDVFAQRAEAATSTMAKGIYRSAAR